MRMLQLLSRLSDCFPRLGINAQAARYASKTGADPQRYVSLSLFLPPIPAFFISLLLIPCPPLILPAFFLSFAMGALLLLFLPKLAFLRTRAAVESELPLFLRTLAMLLEFGVPFHNALAQMAKEGFAVSPALARALGEVGKGATVESSLASLAREMESAELKRALSQVISAYEGGGGAREIKRISDNLFFLQQQRMKEFSSRQALFSLLFVAVSTILPAVFLIFLVLGDAAFGAPTDPAIIPFAFLAFFPLLSFAILTLSRSFRPSGSDSAEGDSGFAPLLLLVLFFVALALLQIPPLPMIFLFFAVLAGSVAFFHGEYRRQRFRESVEAGLPDALLFISGSSSLGTAESVFRRMQRGANPALASEIGTTLNQLEANISPDRALEDLWRRNSSPLLKRVSLFFSHLFDAGIDAGRYVGMMAEDLFLIFELRRQRRSALSMQKYTLIFGALILPAVLGNALSLISGISGLLGEGGGVVDSAGPLIPAYLAIYAFLSARFISGSEARPSSLLPYFAALSLAGTILFYLFLGKAFW